MTAEHQVQFGHSGSERLVLSNFRRDTDHYTLDADIRVGSFTGAARVYGSDHELSDLYEALLKISRNLSGEANFENLEGQLKIHCVIGTTGTVHFDIVVSDHHNRVECSIDTDPAELDSTIAALGRLI